MLHNYYTLRCITRELEQTLSGTRIGAIFSQNRNELVVAFEKGPALIISCEPSANFLSLRSSFARAKKNSIDVFPSLTGATVQEFSIAPADREIDLRLQEDRHLLVQLFGSRANVILTDDRRRAAGSFLHPGDLKDEVIPLPQDKAILPDSLDELDSRLHSVGHLPALSVLKKIYPLFGTLIMREMLFRAGIREDSAAVEISADLSKVLFETGRTLDRELRDLPKPRIYSRESSPSTFSIIGLSHLTSHDVREFDSIHTAVQTFISTTFSRKSLLQEKDLVIRSLQKERDHIERTLAKMARDAEGIDRASTYELYGKVLLAHATELHKGMKTASLPNLFSPNKDSLEIPLDPHLTPSRNAERYFDKAKKARHAREEQADRKQIYHEHYERIQRLLDHADPIQTRDQWTEFVEAQRENLENLGIIRKRKEEPGEQVPFRTFVVEGGFQVWAGKNSQNNDLLTMKHSRPRDLWFHARGGSGSHVILRAGTGKGDISKRAVQQAASIAAYYSKLKNSRLVPVAMTERKYVRKPKGAPVGTVTIEREKILMVEPRLPEEKVL